MWTFSTEYKKHILTNKNFKNINQLKWQSTWHTCICCLGFMHLAFVIGAINLLTNQYLWWFLYMFYKLSLQSYNWVYTSNGFWQRIKSVEIFHEACGVWRQTIHRIYPRYCCWMVRLKSKIYTYCNILLYEITNMQIHYKAIMYSLL